MTQTERDRVKAQKLRAFFKHVERTYGLSEAGYRALYAAQGGKCYICRRANGKSRMLAVDHNHVTGEVRGLLCSGSQSANTCNRLIALYSRESLARAVEYVSDAGPPARTILAALAYVQENEGIEPAAILERFPDLDFRQAVALRGVADSCTP